MNKYVTILSGILLVVSIAACKRTHPMRTSSLTSDSTHFVENHDTLSVSGKAAIIFIPTDSELANWFSKDTSKDSEDTYGALDDVQWYVGTCSEWMDSVHIPNRTSKLRYVRLNFPEHSLLLDRNKLIDSSERTASGVMLLTDGESHWIADKDALLDPSGDTTLGDFFRIR